MDILPKIRSSAEIYGYLSEGVLRGVPISGVSVCKVYYESNRFYYWYDTSFIV